jgi:hypothetical protein
MLPRSDSRVDPRLSLRQPLRELGEVLERRRLLGDVSLQPPHRRLLVLRRPALGIQVDELQKVRERQVREVAGGVLGQPECSALYRSTEADVSVRLGGHERMFS